MGFCISCLCTLIGAIVLIKMLYKLAYFIYTLKRKPLDLVARYGKLSYAVITGSSDGIGKEYAIQLARRGFNLVLVARNQSKLEAVKAQINKEFPLVDIKIIVIDFAKCRVASDYESVKEQLSGLNIGMLVNNVGIIDWNYFHETSDSKVNELIATDELSYIYMTKLMIPMLLKRTERSAVLMVSSGLSHNMIPYCAMYSMIKASINAFCTALMQEYSKNIDFIYFDIGNVVTKLNPSKTSLHITPEQCVSSCLSKVGYEHSSPGHWWHSFLFSTSWMMSASKCDKIGVSIMAQHKKAQ